MPTPALSRGKKLLFTLIPVSVLLLLLLGMEAALRLFTESPDAPLVTEVQYDGVTWNQTNRSFLKRYFPANSPSIPEFKTTLFRKEKTPQTYRVMCLGGSTMFGTPYDMNANIPGIVRRQLRHLYPDREIEVVNWGASAINSNVIRDFAPRLLEFEPDLILLYMGHNEFYGPDGIGASFLERYLPFLTRWKYAMRNLRLVQLAQSLLYSLASDSPSLDSPNLMKQVSAGQLVPSNSPDEQRIFDLFQNNLERIVEVFQERQIPVLTCEVSSNLMFPPFVSDSIALGSNYRSIADQLLRRAIAQDYAGVEVLYQQLLLKDSTHALLHYWYGRSLLANGKDELARRQLTLARDFDLLKFRAPSRMNGIIRDVCRETGSPLIRVDSLFSALGAHGIPGDSLFWEHLHPTLRGYYEIAHAIVEKIVADRLIAQGRPVRHLLPCNADSLHICWLEQAYADLSIQHLTGRWPFENFKRAPVVITNADPSMNRLVRDVYERRVEWNDGCYRSAAYFWGVGELDNAQTSYLALLDDYPYSFYTNYLYGSLLNFMGRREEAVSYYTRSITANPRYAKSRLDLGLIEVNRGNMEIAISELTQVLTMVGPKGANDIRAGALYGLGAVYANRGEYAKALQYLDESVRVLPGYADALRLRDRVQDAIRGR